MLVHAVPRGDRLAAAANGASVVWLESDEAQDAGRTGAKAARLAEAARRGLPVLPGFVVPTATCATVRAKGFAGLTPAEQEAIRQAWEALSGNGAKPVVARSTSPSEDGEHSSMAGRFTSVLGVSCWAGLAAAIEEVVASSLVIDLANAGQARQFEMAVLVQPELDPVAGGVMLGVDPIDGRRAVVVAAARHPSDIVSGAVDGAHLVLSRRGRLRERSGDEEPRLARGHRRGLARLAARTEDAFGSPQDNEWAIEGDGALWLLQSRPVTSVGGQPTGPVFGIGPVAETFPAPLRPLEQDLWLEPLRDGMRHALRASRAVSSRRLAASPLVVAVGGRVAVDIELLGVHRPRRSWLARLDPRPPARRLGAAWRTGRLRAAVPALAAELAEVVDGELASIPALASLPTTALVGLLDRARQLLVALHGQEVLAGMVAGQGPEAAASSGASAALRALARGQAAGLRGDDLVAAHPEVLALSAPRIGGCPLPSSAIGVPEADAQVMTPRETLRLRIRWTHELMARAALEVGRRTPVEDAEAIAMLGFDEVGALVEGLGSPDDLAARTGAPESAPLPAAFRLSTTGAVVPVDDGGGRGGAASRAASGGRWTGVAVHSPDDVTPGSVLVVRTLDPDLAAVLPVVGGIVAETGSPLSHLAILARELGVPAVVGVAGALSSFPEGAVVALDGTTGEVRVA